MMTKRSPVIGKTVLALLAGLAMAGSAHSAPGSRASDIAPAPSATDVLDVKMPASIADGSYSGKAIGTKYGAVQVKVTISGGKLVAADAVRYPSSKNKSRKISGRSLPALERSAIRSQSAMVDFVSGATLTSKAFARSLASALASAGQ